MHWYVEGAVDMSAAPMDDFDVVLGLDFLRKAKVVLMTGEDRCASLRRDSVAQCPR